MPGQVSPGSGFTLDSVDTSKWRHWWTLNKEPYLGLRAAIRDAGVLTGSDDFFLGNGPNYGRANSALVTDLEVEQVILPVFAERLETARSADLLASTLLALAEAGAGRECSPDCLDLIVPFLDDGRNQVAEAATVAVGVLGDVDALEILERMVHCRTDDLGREHELDFGPHVPSRQRAFGSYALGLLGARAGGYTRTRIVNGLTGVVLGEAHRSSSHEVPAAAVLALGLVPLPVSATPFDVDHRPLVQMTRQEQVRWLLGVLDEPRLNPRVRAMAPTSIARLLQDTPADFELRDLAAQRLTALLGARSGERSQVRRSCALALGWIADCDDDPVDVASREALIEAADDLPDQQARHFALIALGRAAGRPGNGADPLAGVSEVRAVLGRYLARGSTPVRPWSAIAIAVLERSLDERRQPSSDDMKRTLRTALSRARTPDETGAYAIAVGITRNPLAAPALRTKLESVHDSQARADVAMALGMVGDTSVVESLRVLIENSRTQAVLQESAAIGLILIGDKTAADTLGELFGAAKSLASQASLLSALGRTGDARSVDLLAGASASSERTTAAQALAIEALGRVAERADLPWTARLSVGASYLSGIDTLTSLPRGAGIVDLGL